MSDKEAFIGRIKIYLNEKNISVWELERVSGITKGILNNAIRNNSAISSDNVSLIIQQNPDINAEWLLTGKGEMLNVDNYPFDIANEKQGEYISLRESKLPIPKSQQFIFPMLGMASAGYIVGYSQEEIDSYLDSYMLPFQKSQNIRAFVVYGQSMYPLLNTGDLVFGQRVLEPAIHRFYKKDMYIIVCSEGIIVKHAVRTPDGDALQLIPANPDYRPDNIENQYIYEIWRVEGKYVHF